MKFIISILLIALLSFASGFYLPWWSIGLAAFIVAVLIYQKPGTAFLSGFLGVFLLWGILSWIRDVKNEGILSHKIAAIFPLGGSAFLLILVTATIGGLVAGMAALSGSYLRRIGIKQTV